ILAGLLLATGLARSGDAPGGGGLDRELLREIAVNGSILLLAGSFLIGCITGHDGLTIIAPFIVDPFKGVLCIFLLDMGLIAGRGFTRSGPKLDWRTVAFGLYMPLIGAAIGYIAAAVTGMETGSAALLMTLSASASYIAVPAAMRLALPEADPAISLTLSLAITFPFNLTLGIPLYVAVAGMAL
ncbi:MAG: sodium-dependent bicarbonate transport family permease, partial [Rhodospirillales bacterium]